jgi:drug/metabolite transporter (DMT)-like permease
MSDIPLWVYIGFGAQLLWVAGNLFDKYLIETFFRGEDDEDDEGIGTLVLFSAFFALLLSAGIWIGWGEAIAFDQSSVLWGLAIGLLNAVWVIAYLYAIGRSELTKTVPIFQTIPVFGFIFGFLLLGEVVTTGQFFAATSLMLGSFILSYNFKEKTMSWLPLFLMLGASATVALQEVIFKLVALETTFVTSAFWQGIGLGLAGAILYVAIPNYRTQFNTFIHEYNGKIWGVSALNEIFDNAATLVFSYAILLGPVLLVQAVNAYQPLVLLLVSYIVAIFFGNYLREDTSQASTIQKVIGIATITAGSVWLYLSI